MDFTFPIKDIFKDQIKEIGVFLKEEFQFIVSNKILEYQNEEYKRNYFTKTLLFRNKPVPLIDIYFPLQIQTRSAIDAERISTDNIEGLFKRNNKVTIVGSAGSGKSTLLKYLYLKAVWQKFKIPLKIELRYLNDYNQSLIEYFKEKIFKLNELAKSDRIIKRLLHSGKFLIFLDGFDEINPEKMSSTLKEIDDLTKIYPNNCYLITSRKYLSVEELPLFDNYFISNLEGDDIDRFVMKQLKSFENEITKKILQVISSKTAQPYESFLKNPLLLTMFILTFQISAEIPTQKNLFYSKVFDALAYEHDSYSKLSYNRKRHSKLTISVINEVLQVFSFITYFNSEFDFYKDKIFELFDVIKNEFEIEFEKQKLLNDLLISICIFIKDGDKYYFAHRSLQEYFAAIYIKNSNIHMKVEIYNMLKERLLVQHFQNVGTNTYKDKGIFGISILKIIDENLLSLLSEIDVYYYIEKLLIPTLTEFKKLLLEVINSTNGNEEKWISKFDSLDMILLTLQEPSNVKKMIGEENIYTSTNRSDIITKEDDGRKKTQLERINDSIDICNSFIAKGYLREKMIMKLLSKKNKE